MTALTQALNHSITMEQKLRAKDEVIEELLELLNRYTATAEVKIQEGRIESEADCETYIQSAKLLNKYYGKKYSVSGVEELMNKI